MAEAYPLYWPEGWKRTTYREHSRFKTGFGAARNFLFEELSRMDASKIILSTAIPLRNDGLPRANMAPDGGDAGAAVYFVRKGKNMVFACDKFKQSCDNIYAIGKTIEAMRGIERWGASDMMERAFSGFVGLPAKASEPWREVLGFGQESVTSDDLEVAYKKKVMIHHPDRPGGDRDKFERVVEARKQALEELK